MLQSRIFGVSRRCFGLKGSGTSAGRVRVLSTDDLFGGAQPLDILTKATGLTTRQSEYWRGRHFSSTTGSNGLRIGTDLLEDSLTFGSKRKIYFDGYSASGFDVNGMDATEGETVHINGSCIAFPHALYLWEPKIIKDVTAETLGLLTIRRPRAEILLIGTPERMDVTQFNNLFKELAAQGTVVEQMDLVSSRSSLSISKKVML
jgi:uncharacterized protein